MIDKQLKIATITKPFGLKGRVKARTVGETLGSLPLPYRVFIRKGNDYQEHQLNYRSGQKDRFILGFEQIDSPELAESLRGLTIHIPRNELPPTEKGEFYFDDLVGFHPRFQQENLTNYRLMEVMDNPAQAILIFRSKQKEIMVPFVKEFVGEISLEEESIEIKNWNDWHEV